MLTNPGTRTVCLITDCIFNDCWIIQATEGWCELAVAEKFKKKKKKETKSKVTKLFLQTTTESHIDITIWEVDYNVLPYKVAIFNLDIPVHTTVITKTDGKKAKSRILMAMGWMHLGTMEQKEILPDCMTAERRTGGRVLCMWELPKKRVRPSRQNGKGRIVLLFAYMISFSP